jgi:hypothetical protein
VRKFFLLIVLAVSISFAQPYNVKVTNYAFSGFKADSLKQTPYFNVGDYEGIDFVIRSTAKDSSVFAVCYQRGYPDGDGNIIPDRPASLIDTMNTLTSGNFQTLGSWINSAGDSDLVAAIDTVQLANYVTMVKTWTPKRSPYGRLFIKGLTGNKKANYNVFVTVVQTKYIRTDVGTGKQPEY